MNKILGIFTAALMVAGCASQPRALYLQHADTRVLEGPFPIDGPEPFNIGDGEYFLTKATSGQTRVNDLLRTVAVPKDFHSASVTEVVEWLTSYIAAQADPTLQIKIVPDVSLRLAPVFDIHYPMEEVGGELRPIRDANGNLPPWHSLRIFTTSGLSNVRPSPTLLQYLNIMSSMCGITYTIEGETIWIRPESSNNASQPTQ